MAPRQMHWRHRRHRLERELVLLVTFPQLVPLPLIHRLLQASDLARGNANILQKSLIAVAAPEMAIPFRVDLLGPRADGWPAAG
jgi:hypothetical protein